MNLFLKKLGKAFKNLLIFAFIVCVVVIGVIYHDIIIGYIIHSRSFIEVNLGDKDYKNGNYQVAIDHYKKALELYPRHVKARYNLANIYVAFEDYESAVREYQTVLEYAPDYLNAHLSLGIIYAEELTDYNKAINEYEKIIRSPASFINIPFIYDNRDQIIQTKATAYYNMGLAYRDASMLYEADSIAYRELLFKAANSYEQSLKLNNKNYDAQYNLALTDHLLGLYTDALTGYCKAMLIAPLNYEAHYNLAVLLKEKSLYKDSYEEFKDASSLVMFEGDTSRASYIYGMLADVSKMAIAEYGYEPKNLIKKLDSEIENNTSKTDDAMTINGLENAIKRRIRTASICKNYLNGT